MKLCVFGDARGVHLQRNLSGLAALGLDVTLLTHNPSPIAGVEVARFQVPPLSWRYPLCWRQRWRKLIRETLRRFDVVNVQFLHDWGLVPEDARRGTLVLTPWGSDIVAPPGEDPPAPQRVEQRRALLCAAAAVTAWGPTFAEQVADFAGAEVAPIHIVPLGVDTELFRPREPMSSGGVRRVGFFKGFRAVYGPLTLMRAIPTVVEVLPRTRFHLIGDGPLLAKCKELSGMLGVEHAVQWIRPQPHRNLPNYLCMWDLSVITSVCESFGVSALESSAMAVPVVATDVGGLRDTVVDGVTGERVPPQAPEALADAIIRLLTDEPRRRELGHAGREHVLRHFRQEDALRTWVEVYEEARQQCCVMV